MITTQADGGIELKGGQSPPNELGGLHREGQGQLVD